MHNRKIPTVLVFCSMCVVFTAIPAHAYIDPERGGVGFPGTDSSLHSRRCCGYVSQEADRSGLRQPVEAAARARGCLEGSDFRAAVTSLWFRLITLAIVALVFAEALVLVRGKAQGWTFYLTPPEVAFEVVVRLIAAALAGIVLGIHLYRGRCSSTLAFQIVARTPCRVGDEELPCFLVVFLAFQVRVGQS